MVPFYSGCDVLQIYIDALLQQFREYIWTFLTFRVFVCF